MSESTLPSLEWVVLTMGDRQRAVVAAIDSLEGDPVTVVWNGTEPQSIGRDVRTVELTTNVGIPAGRDIGARSSSADVVAFLDDDAVSTADSGRMVSRAFTADARLGAVALRLVDEQGQTSRRHVPRFGGRDPERGGDVALFLGGACAIRREAYDDAGGYWGDLFYGHEEVEFSWRLIDRGWRILYLPEATVFHPRTDVGRHSDGWRMTGRNRVMIARRTLPWPVAIVHVSAWLVIGLLRAPGSVNRVAYLRGWRLGWQQPVDRRPIAWRTVWRLTCLGRPPIL